jgi:DNA-directed RNA polymerase II subunit RPB1
MAYITQTISERKANVTQIIEDATHDRLKASPGMTIRESFESHNSISLVIRPVNMRRRILRRITT